MSKKQNNYDENFYHSQAQESYDSAKEVISGILAGGGGIYRHKKHNRYWLWCWNLVKGVAGY
ncbi:hypothetical protein [Helicobacter sp.]|uniref:hypothetical protein n=1 Tax=Helicobacter sp. TaxID=218 RepID=UPI0019B05FF1|nr:hypothetical protein [Helicobacter sp.]MBD5165942.1 hypothetical protein [Helicobacter sp.]